MRTRIAIVGVVVCLLGLASGGRSDGPAGSRRAAQASAPGTYWNFESPQARPLAVSADGRRLYAVNTPSHTLALYSLEQPDGPRQIDEIPVGLEPVSVAVRGPDEVWVVNHVSDSISVVHPSRRAVVATIQVGDRPGDVVFAGNPQRAFVTSMTGREVWVIEPRTRRVLTRIEIPGDAPRALLASADGRSVWVAVSRSGNGTTIVPHSLAPKPPAPENKALPPAPRQGLVVPAVDRRWAGRPGRTLPDHDVVEIDAARLVVHRSYQGLGTILFNLAQRPGTKELWVAATEARNRVRFEPQLRGHAVDSRIARVLTGATPRVTLVELNPGVDYQALPNRAALATALAQPVDIVFDPAGSQAYVAAFGTDRIGVLDRTGKIVARIEVGDTPGARVRPRTKRGPRGLVHHPKRALLYVLNRLSNSISVIDTRSRRVLGERSMLDPTPAALKQGRGFLYDAKLSGNGTQSCASCHVDGDRDGLAWDLGNPGGEMFSNGSLVKLHPMKGPLLTQTLRGLAGERIFHWRADRPGLASFNAAFTDLLGGAPLSDPDMATFSSYLRSIRFAPNPQRNRDDTLPLLPRGESARDGALIFRTRDKIGRDGDLQFRCVGCHVTRSGSGPPGFSGLVGQSMKAAQLRGLHERDARKHGLSGFGYGADGSKADLVAYLSSTHRFMPLSAREKRALERYLFAFPTGAAPAVGFSRTLTAADARAATVPGEVRLLVAQATRGNCDLIVSGWLGGRPVGFVYDPRLRRFVTDRASAPALALPDLLGRLGREPRGVLTFLGAPPGSGRRLGIDRDVDGRPDGDQ